VTGWPIATSAAAVLALALAAHAAAACPLQPEDGQAFVAAANGRAEAAGQTPVQAAWRVQGAASPQTLPPTAKPFSLRLKLCPADARLLRVDATMPEHRHGMNYKPMVQAAGRSAAFDARLIEGIVLHMAGRWQFSFEVQMGDKTVRLTDTMLLR
jgi:hypothetical protein